MEFGCNWAQKRVLQLQKRVMRSDAATELNMETFLETILSIHIYTLLASEFNQTFWVANRAHGNIIYEIGAFEKSFFLNKSIMF